MESHHEAGTREYISPEVLRGHYPCFDSDTWSLGCTIYEMIEGKTPFHDKEQEEIKINILNSKYHFTCNFDNLSKDLITKIFNKNPEERIPLKDMKLHSFFCRMEESNKLGDPQENRSYHIKNIIHKCNLPIEGRNCNDSRFRIIENYFSEEREDLLNQVNDKKEDIIISSQPLVKLNNKSKFCNKAIILSSSPSIKIYCMLNFCKLKKRINIKPQTHFFLLKKVLIIISENDNLEIKVLLISLTA